MVKMRLVRLGDKRNPIYRVVVADARKAATGEYIECVGHYRPTVDPNELTIDADKAKDWIAKGAQPTDTVRALLVETGLLEKKAMPAKTNAIKKK